MIFRSLQKVEVVESDRKCKAGSTGYFVCQDANGEYNSWNVAVVFNKFGKKGKPRAELLVLETKMFEYDAFRKSDQEILEIVKEAEKIEPLPSYSGYGRSKKVLLPKTGGTKLKIADPETRDLLSVNDMEFLAYICALSMRISELVYGRPTTALIHKTTPRQMDRFINGGYNLAGAEPEQLGSYILDGLILDAKSKTSTFLMNIAAYISTSRGKRVLLEKMLLPYCMMHRTIKRHENLVEEQYTDMKERIDEIILYYRKSKNKKELKKIKKSLDEYVPSYGYSLLSPRLQKKADERSRERAGIDRNTIWTTPTTYYHSIDTSSTSSGGSS